HDQACHDADQAQRHVDLQKQVGRHTPGHDNLLAVKNRQKRSISLMQEMSPKRSVRHANRTTLM
ncbi:MAG: hypothetical protein WAV27_24560, partial [Xanthobacteraceae bacterium]